MLTAAVGDAKLEAQTPLRAMSAEQLTAFWAAVEADASLQEKLSASTDGEIDTPLEAAAVVAIAKDAGFTITVADLLRADAQAILELNDEELEKVAGGFFINSIPRWFGYEMKWGKGLVKAPHKGIHELR